MINFAKKITISVLILFLATGSMFCCCLTGTAQAGVYHMAEQGHVNGSRCCSEKTKNTSSQNHQDCKCQKFAEISTVQGLSFSYLINSFVRFSDKDIVAAQKISNSHEQFAENCFLQYFARIVKSDPPMYLKNSILRI